MKVNTSPPSATVNLECDGVSHRTSLMYCKPNIIALDKNTKTTYHILCEGVGNSLVNRLIAISEKKMPFHSLYNWEFSSNVLHCEQTLSTGGIWWCCAVCSSFYRLCYCAWPSHWHMRKAIFPRRFKISFPLRAEKVTASVAVLKLRTISLSLQKTIKTPIIYMVSSKKWYMELLAAHYLCNSARNGKPHVRQCARCIWFGYGEGIYCTHSQSLESASSATVLTWVLHMFCPMEPGY